MLKYIVIAQLNTGEFIHSEALSKFEIWNGWQEMRRQFDMQIQSMECFMLNQ